MQVDSLRTWNNKNINQRATTTEMTSSKNRLNQVMLKSIYMLPLLLCCIASALFAQSKETVVVKYLEQSDNPNTYKYDLLKLALELSGEQYELIRIDKENRSDRGIMHKIQHSSEPFVIASGTSPEFEKKLLPIRVPMYLGIGVGYRMMLIRKEIQDSLRSVKTLDDLKKFSIGQGLGWSDVPILENAGLRVIEGTKYHTLFAMTAKGRFDLFSRGLFEIYPEYERYKKEFPDLIVDEHLVLIYPFAMYYFVPKQQQRLHDIIYKGMNNAYESGALQRLIIEHPTLKDTIQRASLAKRIRIELPPFNVSDATLEALERYTLILE